MNKQKSRPRKICSVCKSYRISEKMKLVVIDFFTTKIKYHVCSDCVLKSEFKQQTKLNL